MEKAYGAGTSSSERGLLLWKGDTLHVFLVAIFFGFSSSLFHGQMGLLWTQQSQGAGKEMEGGQVPRTLMGTIGVGGGGIGPHCCSTSYHPEGCFCEQTRFGDISKES